MSSTTASVTVSPFRTVARPPAALQTAPAPPAAPVSTPSTNASAAPKPTALPAANGKQSPSKGGKGRSGAPNYSRDDITSLLDIVEKVEPTGSILWALVASEFSQWSIANARPIRDQDSLKNKFDKLCNAKKKTGDPSCPPDVRRAKNIGREIQGKIAAIVLGDDKEPDAVDVGENSITEGQKKSQENETIGGREKRRAVGVGGLTSKRGKTEEVLVDNVEKMAGFIGMIANSMHSGNDSEALTATQQYLIANTVKQEVKMLKDEVNQSMHDTHAMVAGMNSVLQQLVAKISGEGSSVILQ